MHTHGIMRRALLVLTVAVVMVATWVGTAPVASAGQLPMPDFQDEHFFEGRCSTLGGSFRNFGNMTLCILPGGDIFITCDEHGKNCTVHFLEVGETIYPQGPYLPPVGTPTADPGTSRADDSRVARGDGKVLNQGKKKQKKQKKGKKAGKRHGHGSKRAHR